MLNKGLVFISLLLGMTLVSFSAFSEEEDFEKIWMPSQSVMECTELPSKGEVGSTRDNPHVISLKKLLKKSEKLNCNWVEVKVYFTWDFYRSYPATLLSSEKLHDHDLYVFEIREKIVWLENFFDHQKPEFDHQNSYVTVSGLFYDLCYEQDLDVKTWPGYKEGDWVWVMGPCHMGTTRLLKDVIIIDAENSVQAPLSDEKFRYNYGNLVPFPDNSPYLGDIRKVSLDWLSLVQQGDWDSFLDTFNFSDEEKEAATEDAQKNFDSFYKEFFLNNVNSLSGFSGNLKSIDYKIFVQSYRKKDNEKVATDEVAIACFCLDGSCSEFDPIFEREMETYDPPYLCVWLYKYEKENGDVIWAWWDEEG